MGQMRCSASGDRVRHGTRSMGLRGWPESSPSGGADSAEMWEGDEGMSIWAEASGRVAEGVRTDWRRAAQSSKSAGNDGSNIKSGIDSAWVGSKAGVWSRRKSPCTIPRGEPGRGLSQPQGPVGTVCQAPGRLI